MSLNLMSMVSLETLRGLSTVFAFIALCAIAVWTYSGKRRADFEQAANLPFADDDDDDDDDDDREESNARREKRP